MLSSKSSRPSRTLTPDRKPRKKRGGKKSKKERKRLQRIKGKDLEKTGIFKLIIISEGQGLVIKIPNYAKNFILLGVEGPYTKSTSPNILCSNNSYTVADHSRPQISLIGGWMCEKSHVNQAYLRSGVVSHSEEFLENKLLGEVDLCWKKLCEGGFN